MAKGTKFTIEFGTSGQGEIVAVRNLMKELGAEVSEVTDSARGLDDALGNMAKAGLAMDAVRDIMGGLCDVVGQLASDFDSFDKGMRAVSTMAGQDVAGMERLREQVKGLAEEIPLAKDELANGLYQVISNGVPEDNWIDYLKASARSAVGGMADLGQTVTVTSTLIKNYGLEWDKAGEIQDKIQTTAKNGVTTFEQMAQALPRVAGQAAQLGVSVDELMGAFATLTGVSGSTAEVSTQLAAVFTALVAPSSQATEMAKRMGVEFDAAAVKAAGGMEQFLTQLDKDIKQYAADNGMLAENIYATMFGSAESLRALIPLTGELRDKFGQNVAAMAQSTGEMDNAFKEMSGSGEAAARKLRNMMSNAMEWAGSMASAAKPMTDLAMGALSVMASLWAMQKAVVATVAAVKAMDLAQVKNVATQTTAAIHAKMTAAAQNMLAAAGVTAASGTAALTVAVTALYAALSVGITLAVTALAAAIAKAGSNADDAADKVEKTDQATETYKNTVAGATAEIEGHKRKLQELIKSNGDERDTVEELNGKYGTTMGYHKTAAEWYDTLIGKSKAYCTQLGYEAEIKQISADIAKKELDREELRAKLRAMKKNGTYEETSAGRAVGGGISGSVQIAEEGVTKQTKAARKTIGEINEISGDLYKSSQRLAMATAERDKALAELNKGGDNGKHTPKTYVPEAPTRTATAKGSNKQEEKAVLVENARTYEELSNNVRIYDEQLKKLPGDKGAEIEATVKARDAAKEQMEQMEALWETYKKKPEEAVVETDAGKLRTLGEMDKALETLNSRRQAASERELAEIALQERAVEKKREALESVGEVARMNAEAMEMGQMGGEALEVRLELEGLDGIEEKIRRLKAALRDVKMSPEMRQETQKSLQQWEAYEKRVKRSQVTMRGTYEEIKGVGQGVKAVTQALKGQGSAWDKVTGVVDGALQAYDGVKKVIEIMRLLGLFTDAQTAKKGAEAVVTGQAAAAAVAGETSNAAASVATAAVLGVETAQWQALAAAKTFAAHAYIPFAGTAIAAGLIATQEAIVAACAIPKFADGGLAYGPTLGLFGEYAGASGNPEVVAPLDKLRALLDRDDMMAPESNQKQTMRVRGKDIEIVLNKRLRGRRR